MLYLGKWKATLETLNSLRKGRWLKQSSKWNNEHC